MVFNFFLSKYRNLIHFVSCDGMREKQKFNVNIGMSGMRKRKLSSRQQQQQQQVIGLYQCGFFDSWLFSTEFLLWSCVCVYECVLMSFFIGIYLKQTKATDVWYRMKHVDPTWSAAMQCILYAILFRSVCFALWYVVDYVHFLFFLITNCSRISFGIYLYIRLQHCYTLSALNIFSSLFWYLNLKRKKYK